MKVNYFFRNIQAGYSIQSVFNTILNAVSKQLTVKSTYLPSPFASVTAILKNGFYACKRQGKQEINHVTGDVHYLLYILNARRTVVTVHDIMYYHYLKGIKKKLWKWIYIDCLKRVSPSMSARILQPGAIYQKPPLIEKYNPYTTDWIETDNLTKTYQGFSPELSKEVLYRMDHGEAFHDIITLLHHSTTLYIHKKEDKEYFHVIPLTHLHQEYTAYPLFDGLDQHYDLIDEKDRIKQQTSDLAKFIQNEYQRNVHKLNKLQQTLFESQNSDDLRIKGDLLFANLHLLKKGQKEITVENYYDGTMMTIPLDERYDGKTNANKYYAKYQKAKKALSHLQEQIQITENEIHYFDTLITMMDNASYYDALEIKEELENLGYLKKKKTKQVHRPQKLHIETYITKDQIPIYVGKNNLQNDYLTFKMAAKNDMWFHVKDMPGSHVVVHSQNLDEYTIRLASQLAAYFSKGKHSSSVPVNYTLVKTLKKPQGGKPGQVILSHYSTIYIDPDESLFNDIHKVNS